MNILMAEMLQTMKHSPLRNYAGIPGLTSWLIGNPSEKGTVRMFECEREHFEHIIPHSHRYNFMCFVLTGQVENTIWSQCDIPEQGGDMYRSTEIEFTGEGKYVPVGFGEPCRWMHRTFRYKAGETYSMEAQEVHSIRFSRGTKVLFLEGPKVSEESLYIEPYVNGETVPVFKVEPWMFLKDKP